MKKNVYRIYDNTLLRFIDDNQVDAFCNVKDEIQLDSIQYLENFLAVINSTVWNSGINKDKINKTWNTLALFRPEIEIIKNCLNVSLMLKQGYSNKNLFGILVVIKSSKTNDVLISKIFEQNEFHITNNKELIDGSFWLEEATFKIPKINDIMVVDIVNILYSDIDANTGYISNYPTEFIPLIDEKPVPDYIQTKIAFDINHFLKINLTTTENKTVKQSILDYFELEMANIEVKHIINYGTELLGFKSISVINNDDIFGPINIGLNLLEFSTETNDIVNIFVSTEILVDEKLIVRQASLNTTLLETINPLVQNMLRFPETVYPVNVSIENVVQNTVIEARESVKFVPIIQPVFAELITDDINFNNQNIKFDNVVADCYLSIGDPIQQVIESHKTSDNIYYFDLSELTKPIKNTTYELRYYVGKILIGKGNFLI